MSAPENPSAFPREDYQTDDAPGQRGMTLRDWFAGKALTMPRPSYWRGPEEDPLGGTADAIARRAYRIADAMLAARAKAVS